jgi:hypothetical protein
MVRFEIVLAPDLPPCIAGPAHFQSAVLNLVINARDAMLKGGALSVSTSAGTLTASDLTGNSDAKPGRFVSVCIRDTGAGMSADVLARVFEPFFTTRQAGGGYRPRLVAGLWLCRSVGRAYRPAQRTECGYRGIAMVAGGRRARGGNGQHGTPNRRGGDLGAARDWRPGFNR